MIRPKTYPETSPVPAANAGHTEQAIAPVEPRTSGRPRSVASRNAVLSAAYDLLIEGGLDSFNIEAVAARAGVAKTTIYRSWASKGALALESFLEVYRPTLTFDHALPPAEGLRVAISSLVAALMGPAARLTTSIIAEAQRDEEVRALFRDAFSAPLRAKSDALIRAGMANGTFRKDLDPSKVIDAFVGAAYLRLIFDLPIDLSWADDLTVLLLNGCLDRPRPIQT